MIKIFLSVFVAIALMSFVVNVSASNGQYCRNPPSDGSWESAPKCNGTRTLADGRHCCCLCNGKSKPDKPVPKGAGWFCESSSGPRKYCLGGSSTTSSSGSSTDSTTTGSSTTTTGGSTTSTSSSSSSDSTTSTSTSTDSTTTTTTSTTASG